jgi:hypothetical protein
MVNHPAVAIRVSRQKALFIGFRPAAFEIQIGEVSGGTNEDPAYQRNKIPVQTVKPVIGRARPVQIKPPDVQYVAAEKILSGMVLIISSPPIVAGAVRNRFRPSICN